MRVLALWKPTLIQRVAFAPMSSELHVTGRHIFSVAQREKLLR